MTSKLKRGFSLIELLAVMALGTVIASLTVASFSTVSAGQAITTDRSSVVALLNQARSLSMAGKDASDHGVHIETSSATLFTGDAYSPDSPSNVQFGLSSNVEMTDVSFSDIDTDIIFKNISGETDNAMSFMLSVVGRPSVWRRVTVSGTGIIDAN